ncbi:MAG: hypothetical protein AAF585_08410 [Verrucomicrobiota bacterium]
MVIIADERHMREALSCYRNQEEVISALRPHVGEQLRILHYVFPHGSGVQYGLEGIDVLVWEECLIDWTIQPGHPASCAANEIYNATVETIDGEQFVMIRDKKGRLFSQSWHPEPQVVAEDLNQIATVRVKPAFEHRFGFGGDYFRIRPS